jgi:YggT family protein
VTILCALLTVYIIVVFARIILSWFPLQHDSPVAPVARLLYDLTEPVMAPLRRIIPPIGMIDISATVLIIGLFVLRSAVCR